VSGQPHATAACYPGSPETIQKGSVLASDPGWMV